MTDCSLRGGSPCSSTSSPRPLPPWLEPPRAWPRSSSWRAASGRHGRTKCRWRWPTCPAGSRRGRSGWGGRRCGLPAARGRARAQLLEVDAALGAVPAAPAPARRRRAAQLLGGSARPRHRGGAGFLRRCCRASCARARSRASWSTRSRGRPSVPAAEVRRAVMLARRPGRVAAAAADRGAAGLARFRLTLAPARPADARPARRGRRRGARAARRGGAGVEARRRPRPGAPAGDEVRVFTRSLDEVTGRVPEVVDAVAALPARALMLDGEAIALRADGRPQPFQVTMRRFGTQARRRAPARRAAADAVLLRPAAPRRRGPARPPRGRAGRRAGRGAAADARGAADRHRPTPRSAERVLRRRARRAATRA